MSYNTTKKRVKKFESKKKMKNFQKAEILSFYNK
jgi:hypothetical protein